MKKTGIAAVVLLTGTMACAIAAETATVPSRPAPISAAVKKPTFGAWGVDLARQVGLTLVGRARGKRFTALSGEERIIYDQNLTFVEEESARHKRKGEDRED